MKKLLLAIAMAISPWAIFGQNPTGQTYRNLMPVPQQIKWGAGKFRLKKQFTINVNSQAHPRLYAGASRFLRRLAGRTGLDFEQEWAENHQAHPIAEMKVVAKSNTEIKLGMDESYKLKVSNYGVELTAVTDVGALRGLETVLQLLESDPEGYYFPEVDIEDKPRFPWRGLLIDVSRHFQPLSVIKRNIDGMAAVKMNTLHFHLTDDHGFRIESKTYPQLHQKASDGQYFTHEQIREIIAYAAERGIRVMPEFGMPSHGTSWLVVFPEIGSAPGPYKLQKNAGIFDPTIDPTNEKSYEILGNFLAEMASLFPEEYIHIGGDENEGHHWDKNPEIQSFIKAQGLKDNHGLQAYFNIRIQKQLLKVGKKMIGWDEILNPALPKDIVIHSWRGIEGLKASAKAGYSTVLSNGYYIDLMHPAKHHYVVDPLPQGHGLTTKQAARILGGEATMWSELVTPMTIDSRIWPRTAAIAERLWSPSEVKDINDMYRRLKHVSLKLEELGLTHISNQAVILRNLAGGEDIAPLKVLADVSEPMKGYTRNPEGKLYTTFSPYTKFADATIADAPVARQFNQLVEKYLRKPSSNCKAQIVKWLKLWQNNHLSLQPMITQSPILTEIGELSQNLAIAADIGLTAINGQPFANKMDKIAYYRNSIKKLNLAREQGGRVELQVIDAIESLLKYYAASIPAVKSQSKVTIDGELSEWQDDVWEHFLPVKHSTWRDSARFAVKWDKSYLYLAFKVKNSNLQAKVKNRDGQGLYKDDGVEVLLDPRLDKSAMWQEDDIAYHLNILNAVLDDRGTDSLGDYNLQWNGQAKTAVKLLGTANNPDDQDEGYQVEIAISWQEIGRKPKEKLSIGINLCVNDTEDDFDKYRYYDFMNLDTFHNPARFAELILVKDDTQIGVKLSKR